MQSTHQGLSKVEVQHLQVVVTLARMHKGILIDYVDCRDFEAEFLELSKKYKELLERA